jgi:hypothetical protein
MSMALTENSEEAGRRPAGSDKMRSMGGLEAFWIAIFDRITCHYWSGALP